MEFEDLKTFVEVANAGGISAAARRLGVSKSIVSRRLHRLEATLGAQLLARTTRGAALTEAGTIFRDHAAKATAEIETARETILPDGDLQGLLRIAVPLSFGPTHFAPLIADMARRHPHLHVHASYTDRFVDLVGEGYDCAIRVGNLPDSSLIARKIGVISGRLVASPDYIRRYGLPQTPADIATHQALMHGTESWRLLHRQQGLTVQPQGRFKADNAPALVEAAVAGLGIARVPDCFVMDHLAEGTLVTILPAYPVADGAVYVVRPPAQHPMRKLRVLIEMLLENYARNPHLWGREAA